MGKRDYNNFDPCHVISINLINLALIFVGEVSGHVDNAFENYYDGSIEN